VTAGAQVWDRTATFAVGAAPRAPILELQVAGRSPDAQPVLTSRAESVPVRAVLSQARWRPWTWWSGACPQAR